MTELPRDAGTSGLDAGRRAGLVAALAVMVALAGWLRVGFLLDDWFHVDRAGRALTAGALDYAIRTDDYGIVLWVHPDPVHFEFFRPLSALSMWIERHAWGVRPWASHLVNLGLHALNAWLLARIAWRCGLGSIVAPACAIAWALSLHTVPAVGWVSGRTEILWGLCALVATAALILWRDGGSHAWLALALVSSALAATAKETGFVAPVLAMIGARLAALAQPPLPGRTLTPDRIAWMIVPSVCVFALRTAFVPPVLPPKPYLDV